MFVTNAFFLAAWDPQTPLKAAILSGVTNLGLDLLLVNVFGWGIAGAAIATVAAQACSLDKEDIKDSRGNCSLCLSSATKDTNGYTKAVSLVLSPL